MNTGVGWGQIKVGVGVGSSFFEEELNTGVSWGLGKI